MIRTALTDLLNIKHPILNAPMASSATAELAELKDQLLTNSP